MSAASCVSTVSGTITAHFERFSELSGLNAGVSREGLPVLFNNTTWVITIYPGGQSAEDKMVSCFLCNRSLHPCKVNFGVCVVDNTGKEVSAMTRKADSTATSIESGGLRGYPKLASFAALLATCTWTDTLTIRVPITLHQPESITGACMVTESGDVVVSNNPHGLRQSFLSLHDDGCVPHDIWLSLSEGGEKVGAHKLVLAARSPVFRTMFSSEMTEARGTEVNISDFSAAAVGAFVRFLNADQCASATLNDCAQELLAMADKYQVFTLMVMCESYLSSVLAPDNVVSLLKFADGHNATQLKARALAYIVNNAVSSARHMQELSADLLSDLLRAVAEKV
jgi:speckle-type POZ protein